MKLVTIVLPVYNGVTFARLCLEALAAHTDNADYRLIIMDDCSDRYTADFLQQSKDKFEDCTLLRNEENLGFVRTCNRAWDHCTSPYVLLLNSDVLVTPNWLPRLVSCAESDPRVATVNPLTNQAPNISLPLPQGCNHLGLDRQLAAHAQGCHDVVTGVGFCLLLRRQAVGKELFDEAYGKGYGEESDLCMRLTTSGWRTVCVGNVYVHHRGHATFTDRDARYLANRRLFDSRWKDQYQAQYRAFQRRNPLRKIRRAFADSRHLVPARYALDTVRAVRAERQQGRWVSIWRALLRCSRHPLRTWYPYPSLDVVRRCARTGAPSVTYVFDGIGVAGGVLSVIQLVNELIFHGFDARIATTGGVDPAIRDWTWLLTEPMVYATPEQLIRDLPPTDIAVATIWTTARWVRALGDRRRARALAYFIQEYESWIIPEGDQTTRQRVVDEYGLIPNRIVKSEWLADKLDADGYQTRKIRLGMNLDQFYPRDRYPGPLTVLTLARPATPWRGFSAAVAALAEVKRRMPDVRVVFFGSSNLKSEDIPFKFESVGVVTDQKRLSQLYSEADVFLENSTWQGFGRCALEAMACGTAVVLTPVGGVMEYARPDVNCLVVPPDAPDLSASAVLRLLNEPTLRARLRSEGLKTAQLFCHRREARETAGYFRSLLGLADEV